MLLGVSEPKLQVAPVLERLVLPRAQASLIRWLEIVSTLEGMRWLVPAHYEAPINFSKSDCVKLQSAFQNREWAPSKGDWKFLHSIDQQLVSFGVVPDNPELIN